MSTDGFSPLTPEEFAVQKYYYKTAPDEFHALLDWSDDIMFCIMQIIMSDNNAMMPLYYHWAGKSMTRLYAPMQPPLSS